MNRLSILISAGALAALAGCATEHAVTPAPAPVVVTPPAPVVTTAPSGAVVVPAAPSTVVVAPAPAPLQAGYGRIETIVAVPPAAAGGSSPANLKRLGVRMDNGAIQYLDVNAATLGVGDRVEITREGKLRHPV